MLADLVMAESSPTKDLNGNPTNHGVRYSLYLVTPILVGSSSMLPLIYTALCVGSSSSG